MPDGKICNGGRLILFVLILFIFISSGSFAWGYSQAGYEAAARWIIVFGVFWLFAQRGKWKWFTPLAIMVTLFLAIVGVWFDFIPGLMFSGTAFGFFALNLTEFQQRLKKLFPREDGKGMTRRHLIRIGFLVVGAVLLTLALGIRR